MRPRATVLRGFTLGVLIVAAGCDRQETTPAPDTATPAAATPAPTRSPSASTPAPVVLDLGALIERQDPDRVLRYYTAALAGADWAAAARAWGEASGVTAGALKAEYDGKGLVTLEADKGVTEGAAGSLFYEAPVVLRIGGGEGRSGLITLRRVNDVEGASEEQLRWHIERSTVGPALAGPN
jgi:hypothetical protein